MINRGTCTDRTACARHHFLAFLNSGNTRAVEEDKLRALKMLDSDLNLGGGHNCNEAGSNQRDWRRKACAVSFLSAFPRHVPQVFVVFFPSQVLNFPVSHLRVGSHQFDLAEAGVGGRDGLGGGGGLDAHVSRGGQAEEDVGDGRLDQQDHVGRADAVADAGVREVEDVQGLLLNGQVGG